MVGLYIFIGIVGNGTDAFEAALVAPPPHLLECMNDERKKPPDHEFSTKKT
jgi:hypothetical protein